MTTLTVRSRRDDCDDSSGDQIAQGEGQLDADGKLTINCRHHGLRPQVRLPAIAWRPRVTDQANREITGRGWVIATYGSFVVNVAARPLLLPARQPGRRSRCRRATTTTNPCQHALTSNCSEWYWRDTSKAHGRSRTADVDTGADGSGNAQLDHSRRGRLVSRARDRPHSRGPRGGGSDPISGSPAAAAGRPTSNRVSNKEVQIIPDKKTYQAGDTAKLLIVTGKPNTPVYVTVEGRDLRQLKLIRSTDSTAVFEVPVTAADEPGIHVGARSSCARAASTTARSTSRCRP